MAGLSDEDSGSDGWNEEFSEPGEAEKYLCLLCADRMCTENELFRHLSKVHDWTSMFGDKDWKIIDQYGWIRFVNIVRKKHLKDWREVFSDPDWNSDSKDLLYPVLKDDAVLTIDIEDAMDGCTESDKSESPIASTKKAVSPNSHPNSSFAAPEKNELAVLHDLELENASLRTQLAQCKSLLKLALDSTQPEGHSVPQATDQHDDAGDSAYFTSYGHFSIHAEMIGDRVRTQAYRDFILGNAATYFAGKQVVDVGCGTGILCLFAADAGAAHVYGVEASSEIFAAAQETIEVNGYRDRISLIRGRAETVVLPVAKVDVVISEWMGYFLFFESMLDSVLDLAGRYLPSWPSGRILPRHYSLHLMGVSMQASELGYRHAGVWTNAYGYRMPSLHRAALAEAHVIDLSAGAQVRILTPTACRVHSLDLEALRRSAELGRSQLGRFPFQLVVGKPGDGSGQEAEGELPPIDALVGYFDVEFDEDAPVKVSFSTSPLSPPTHWKQTVFFLESPLHVCNGDTITGSLTVNRARCDSRGLEITMTIESVGPRQEAICQRFMLTS